MNYDITVNQETGKISYLEISGETRISFCGIPPKVEFIPEDRSLDISSLFLVVSQDCNMCCTYCFANDGMYDKAGLMSAKTAKKAVELFRDITHSNCRITFFGGEPLLNFEVIRETVNYAGELFKDRTVSFALVTNGTIITNEIVDFLKKNGFIVQVSVDGNERFHDNHRKFKDGRPTYQEIMLNVKAMKEAGVFVSVRATLCHGNTDLKDFLKYCANDLGVNVGFVPVRSDEEELIFGKEDVDALCKTYKDMFQEVVATGRFTEILRSPPLAAMIRTCFELENLPPAKFEPDFCHAGKKSITVDTSGDVYPCHTFIGYEGFRMGNIECPDMENIQNFVEKAHWKNKITCPHCFARIYCGGGCSHASYTANGDIRVPYKHFCEFMRSMFKLAIIFYVHMKKEGLPYAWVKNPVYLELADLLLKR
jgi:uncharacterized protein